MPRLKLTARTIDSLHTSEGRQVDYWDLDHPGFGVRVAGGGRKTWVVMYREGCINPVTPQGRTRELRHPGDRDA